MGWSAADIPNQQGRIALITGANSGLGLETARALKRCGATVVLACRSHRKAETAKQTLLRDRDGGAVDLVELDLADLASVQRAANSVGERYGGLDLLINNAGVMAPPRRTTAQGHELQFGVNHLGHMALTEALLPLMQNRPDPRVVTVTSGAQYFGKIRWEDPNWSKGYDRYGAYGQSKLANVMFALELNARLREQGSPIRSLAAHPGIARTELQPTAIASVGNRFEALAYRLMDPLFQSAGMGALPQLHAATAASAHGGEHYGPEQFGGLRGAPTLCRVAPAANQPAERQRLWSLSEQLIRG